MVTVARRAPAAMPRSPRGASRPRSWCPTPPRSTPTEEVVAGSLDVSRPDVLAAESPPTVEEAPEIEVLSGPGSSARWLWRPAALFLASRLVTVVAAAVATTVRPGANVVDAL